MVVLKIDFNFYNAIKLKHSLILKDGDIFIQFGKYYYFSIY